MKTYILAIDQGTTGTTARVVDHDGIVRGRGYAKIPQYYPKPGWVEHDPEEIWKSVLASIAAAARILETSEPGSCASLTTVRPARGAGGRCGSR